MSGAPRRDSARAASAAARRPDGAKARGRREAILAAATAILVDDGYARLSTRNIAARAGMRPGNLQYYYRSKNDVVRAMLARYLERAAQAVEERIAARGGSAAERLHAAVEGVLADQESPQSCRFFRELWALAAHDPAVDAAMRDFYTGYWRRVVALLLAINPPLGRPRAERRAALVIAMFEGLMLFRTRQPPHALPIPALEKELHALVARLALDER
jgi:AcrR family transcriptional regulator